MVEAGERSVARCVAVGAAWLALLLAAGSAAADRIRVAGDTLRGRVAELTREGVRFEPLYGEGAILVPYAELEDLRTDESLTVLYGDEGVAHGRIVGFEAGRLLVGGVDAVEPIDPAVLFRAYPAEKLDGSTYERWRRRLRYWSASLDGGAALVQSTTDNTTAFLTLRIERRKDPTRLLVEGSTRYATEKSRGEPRSVTENIVTGHVRGEWDWTERLFAYASQRATYDEDRHISLRLEPRGGLGVRILERDTVELSADVGAAWIYEDYFGATFDPDRVPARQSRGRDNFWTVAFGSELVWRLPFGATYRASAEYLPAVDAWIEDYLLRGESKVDFPLVEWLSFNMAAIDEYDSSPAEGSERNKLTLTAGLSLRF